jgi:hypothetical protein
MARRQAIEVSFPGGARVSRAGDGVSPSRTFSKVLHSGSVETNAMPIEPLQYNERLFWRGRQNQHARRVRYPDRKISTCLLLLRFEFGELFLGVDDLRFSRDAEFQKFFLSA